MAARTESGSENQKDPGITVLKKGLVYFANGQSSLVNAMLMVRPVLPPCQRDHRQ